MNADNEQLANDVLALQDQITATDLKNSNLLAALENADFMVKNLESQNAELETHRSTTMKSFETILQDKVDVSVEFSYQVMHYGVMLTQSEQKFTAASKKLNDLRLVLCSYFLMFKSNKKELAAAVARLEPLLELEESTLELNELSQTLRGQLEASQARRRELEAQNLPLRSEISTLQSEIEVMNSTKGYETEIFRGKLAESLQEVETIRTDLAEARRQNTVLVDQSASHQSEIQIVNSSIAHEGHISRAKLAESYQDAETLKTDLNEARRQNTVLVDQSISHGQAHAELSTKCQSRDLDLEALGHQISAMGEALEEKDEQILTIETEKATIQAHQSTLLTQNHLLEEKLLGLNMIGVLEGKLTALTSALGTIEGNCEDLTKERDYFKERYEVAQRDLDEIDGVNGSEGSSDDVK